MRKELSHVMLELYNVRMEPSNVRKKSKGTTKSEKRIITYDVGIAQYEDKTVKCEIPRALSCSDPAAYRIPVRLSPFGKRGAFS